MLQVARWRVVAVLAALVWAVLFALPNVLPADVKARWPAWLPSSGVNLGLDLRGGSYLLMEVGAAELQRERLVNVLDELSGEFGRAEPRIAISGRGVSADGVARVQLADPGRLADGLAIVRRLSPVVPLQVGQEAFTIASTPQGVITLALTPAARAALSRQAVQESIEVIRRRVDELGTAEISIARQGEDRIVIQAPGQGDPETLKRQIGKTAKLTFHLLDENADYDLAREGRAPPGSIILPYPEGGEGAILVLKERALLTGENLTSARAQFEPQTGIPAVGFQFEPSAARRFGRLTTENVGKRFAIVLDDKIITAPSIREPILGGSGQISGGYSDIKEAEELAALLRAGALPAPLTVIEQRSVGPGLGQDSIDAGVKAGIIGGVAVLVLMALFYGLFGLIAVAALLLNGLMIVAGMSMIGATLTLPGIAGLILTMGMAVDANVLIYERMREEKAAGKGVAMAVDSGFRRAWIAIFDANITTLGAAAILFYFGAGPVRGFAWTLSLGVFTSVFTAVLVTQILVAAWFRAVRPKQLPI